MAQTQALTSVDTERSGQQYRVDLFGGLQLWHGTRSSGRFRTQKTAALFAYLAFHADRMHARDTLREMFWADSTMQAGSMNLCVALSSIRSLAESLGITEDLLRTERQRVGINTSSVATDVARFEHLLDAAENLPEADSIVMLRNAVSLYRGPLLPTMFDNWVIGQQVRLADRFFQASCRLAQAYRAANDRESSLLCLRRIVDFDPANVEAASYLMRAQIEGGQFAEAARTFHELHQTLSDKNLVNLTAQELQASAEAILGDLYQEIEPHLNSYQRRMATSTGLRKRTRKPGKTDARLLHQPQDSLGPSPHLLQSTGGQAVNTESVPHDMPGPVPLTPGLPPGLPLPMTRFFGRDEEMMRLGWLLGDPSARLVTLTGPGGAGKTRLALAVAQERQRRRDAASHENGGGSWNLEQSPFPELCDSPDLSASDASESDSDVIFISFTDADTAPRLPEILADALGTRLPVRDDSALAPDSLWTQTALNLLTVALAGRPGLLLILDNFETLATTNAAVFLEALLLQATQMKVLATSRCRLPIAGEREFQVPPLLPPSAVSWMGSDRWDLDTLVAEWPSIALFVDRARSALPSFQLTRHNASAVVEIISRLDGLPLAIELAAARCQVFTPGELLKRLDNRFDLLVTTRYGTPDRRHSLRESLLFSYRLLTPELQDLFCRLSVFRGGFPLDAAFSVSEDPLTHDHLARLADASLIQVRSTEDGELRFDLLETLREFAAEQLALLSDSEQESTRARHAHFWVDLAEQAKTNLSGSEQNKWLARLDNDLSNLRATLDFCLSAGSAVRAEAQGLALRLGAALPPYWNRRGMHNEGAQSLSAILAQWGETLSSVAVPGCDTETQRKLAHLWNGLGVLKMSRSEWDAAKAAYNRGLLLWQAIGDARGIAATRNNRAMLEQQTGDLETAQAEYEASLAWWREAGDEANVARVLNNLAALATWQGRHKAAQITLTESLNITRQSGDMFGFASRLHNLGDLALECGKLQRAEPYYKSSLEHAQAGQNWALCAKNLTGLALIRLLSGTRDFTGKQWLETALDYLRATDASISPLVRGHVTRLNFGHLLSDFNTVSSNEENLFDDGFPEIGVLATTASPASTTTTPVDKDALAREALARLQQAVKNLLHPDTVAGVATSMSCL